MARRIGRVRRIWRLVVRIVLVLIVLPIVLTVAYRFVAPPVTPLMILRAIEGEGIRQDWVPLRRISPHAVGAVLALEDTTFCTHAGIDWAQMREAAADYLKGERVRGASTITMQTARNLFLWPGRSVVRKALEAPLTTLLEAVWDKRRILEVYLNIIEWGPGIYGIEEASQTYFRKSAADLGPHEAGLLAAVLPNPRNWSPARPTTYLIERMHTAVARASTLGPLVDCVGARAERRNRQAG
jgi:monofunctional biosynthetic peptidoglycan transglycosylase